MIYLSYNNKVCFPMNVVFSNCVNLDITTMIAYVSSLTNGGCGFVFEVCVKVKCISLYNYNDFLK